MNNLNDLMRIGSELYERYPKGASHVVLRSVEMQVLSKIRPDHNQLLLDLGCGEGAFFAIFRRIFGLNAKRIIGVDLNLEELYAASSLNVYDDLVCCDARFMPFRDRAIDICMSVSVLEHIPEYEKVIAETSRILRENGRIFATVVNAFNFSSNFFVPSLLRKLGLHSRYENYVQKHEARNLHFVKNNSQDWITSFNRFFAISQVLGIWDNQFIYASSKLGVKSYLLRALPFQLRKRWIKSFFDAHAGHAIGDINDSGTLFIEAVTIKK